MKNEEPYVKEWLDYHLLAGVDHFYIYDNDSTPEFKKILQPYIDAGIVTYTFYPGKKQLLSAYNDAVKQCKFSCRYLMITETDEFAFPKSNKSLLELFDEIFALNPTAGGLVFNWHCFGSNGQEKADYSRGVLERFTARAENDWFLKPDETHRWWIGNVHVKTVANPRKIDILNSPHFANYFLGVFAIDEDGEFVPPSFLKFPVKENKIVLNHYVTKSYEENSKRRGKNQFSIWDRNEVFDDGILKYRESRRNALIPAGGGY